MNRSLHHRLICAFLLCPLLVLFSVSCRDQGTASLTIPTEVEAALLRVTFADGPFAGQSFPGVMTGWNSELASTIELTETSRIGAAVLPPEISAGDHRMIVERYYSPPGASRARREASYLGRDSDSNAVVFAFAETLDRGLDTIPVIRSSSATGEQESLMVVNLATGAAAEGRAFAMKAYKAEQSAAGELESSQEGVVLTRDGFLLGFAEQNEESSAALVSLQRIKETAHAGTSADYQLLAPPVISARIPPWTMMNLLSQSLEGPQPLFPGDSNDIQLYLIPQGHDMDREALEAELDSAQSFALPLNAEELAGQIDNKMGAFAIWLRGQDLDLVVGVKQEGQVWKLHGDFTEELASKTSSRWRTALLVHENDLLVTRSSTPNIYVKPQPSASTKKEEEAEVEVEIHEWTAKEIQLPDVAQHMVFGASGRELLVSYKSAPYVQRFALPSGEALPLPEGLGLADVVRSNAEALFVMRKSQGTIERYNLKTLALEKSMPLVREGTPVTFAVGSHSLQAPLAIFTTTKMHFLDPVTLADPDNLMAKLFQDDLFELLREASASANGKLITISPEEGEFYKGDETIYKAHLTEHPHRGTLDERPARHSPLVDAAGYSSYRYLRYQDHKAETLFQWKHEAGREKVAIIGAIDAPLALAILWKEGDRPAYATCISMTESGEPATLSVPFALPELNFFKSDSVVSNVAFSQRSQSIVTLDDDRKTLLVRKLALLNSKADQAPVFLSHPELNILKLGDTFHYKPEMLAPSPEGKFSLQPTLPGATVNSQTGEITWTPEKDFPVNELHCTLTCTAENGTTAQQSFLLTIDSPPPARLVDPAIALQEEDPRSLSAAGTPHQTIPEGIGIRPSFYFSEQSVRNVFLPQNSPGIAVLHQHPNRLAVLDTKSYELVVQKELQDEENLVVLGSDAIFVYGHETQTIYRYLLPNLKLSGQFQVPQKQRLLLMGTGKEELNSPLLLVLMEEAERYREIHEIVALDPVSMRPSGAYKVPVPETNRRGDPYISLLHDDFTTELAVSPNGQIAFLPTHCLVVTPGVSALIPRTNTPDRIYDRGRDTTFNRNATTSMNVMGITLGSEERNRPSSFADTTDVSLDRGTDLVFAAGRFLQKRFSIHSFPDGRPLQFLVGQSGDLLEKTIERPEDTFSRIEGGCVYSDLTNNRVVTVSKGQRRALSFWELDLAKSLQKIPKNVYIVSQVDPLVAAGREMTYQIKANFPDLVNSYELTTSAEGMSIDSETGLFKYQVPEDQPSYLSNVVVTLELVDGTKFRHEFVLVVVGKEDLRRQSGVPVAYAIPNADR